MAGDKPSSPYHFTETSLSDYQGISDPGGFFVRWVDHAAPPTDTTQSVVLVQSRCSQTGGNVSLRRIRQTPLPAAHRFTAAGSGVNPVSNHAFALGVSSGWSLLLARFIPSPRFCCGSSLLFYLSYGLVTSQLATGFLSNKKLLRAISAQTVPDSLFTHVFAAARLQISQ